MARCSKKTVGGGGRQTCNGSQAKGPAAILTFEANKKAKRSAGGKARRQSESRGKTNNHETGTQPGETAAGKGRRKREEKTKGARQPGGTEKRDKRNKKKEEQRKNKGKPPGGRPHRPEPPDTRPPKGGTRGKGLMRLDAQASGPTSPRGVRRAHQDSNQTIKSCPDMCPEGHLLHTKNNGAHPTRAPHAAT